jgi:hypothetical protein
MLKWSGRLSAYLSAGGRGQGAVYLRRDSNVKSDSMHAAFQSDVK